MLRAKIIRYLPNCFSSTSLLLNLLNFNSQSYFQCLLTIILTIFLETNFIFSISLVSHLLSTLRLETLKFHFWFRRWSRVPSLIICNYLSCSVSNLLASDDPNKSSNIYPASPRLAVWSRIRRGSNINC